jgi:ferredoxin--NADP+ reductase
MGDFKYLVAVVGAGPAGLFAARQLANDGAHVFLFNRDIKAGGLAEYGIYPDKHKMRDGLHLQFRQILDLPGVEYYGNIVVGKQGVVSLDDLFRVGFQAVLVTAGAQGTKWLGLPGESLKGVYHAKDIVYYYNSLPPYSEVDFEIGKRVAIIGHGNVMLDIVHFLCDTVKVDEVYAIGRRGPNEVKFEKKELGYVINQLDRTALAGELQRITPTLQAIDQNPDPIWDVVNSALEGADKPHSLTRFHLQFLASPWRILGDASGRVCGLEMEENTLQVKDGEVKARGTSQHHTLDVDTVVFAIGDKVDDGFGLPVNGNEYVKNPEPRFPIDGLSYEVFEPHTDHIIEGVFVAGWSRKASTGLVGVARKDGTNGAKAVMQYLQTLPPLNPVSLDQIRDFICSLRVPIVTEKDLLRLEAQEREQAEQRQLETFKFRANAEMLTAMGLSQDSGACGRDKLR